MATGDPRGAALRLVDLVTLDHRLLSEVSEGVVAALAPADRARAMRLATETLRQMGRADKLLGPLLRKKPPEPVLNLLRLATVELYGGGAAHGVVNAAVTLCRADRANASMSGLVNAVLRRIAETGPAAWPGLAPPELPKWLRKPLIEAWGKESVRAIEAVHAMHPPLDLTPRDGNAEGLARALGGTALPTGSVRLTGPVQVTALPGFAEGRFWVQDAAAALPARVIAARAGENLLDLCAAPGGKTMQLAATGARVTALDISESRLARLRQNLARTRLEAEVVAGDALTHGGGPYDAILLDAPCSATGTIRRHPDLPRAKDGADFPGLFATQAAMIDHAASLLRPGGRLVFCTCSLLPDEGEVQAEAALSRPIGLVADPAALAVEGVPAGWRTEACGLRIRPDHWAEIGGIDGFFIAAFRKVT